MIRTYRYSDVLVVMLTLCTVSMRAASPSYSASVSGYTIIDVGSYSDVRFETSSARKVMPPVSNTSTNPVQASGSSSQSFTTSDPSLTNGFSATTHFQGAGIAGFAAAQAGSVHAWARNTAVAAPPAFLDPDGVPYLPSPYSAIASIAVSARAQDSLTITGSLVTGTAVTFTWNTYADGIASQSGYDPYFGIGDNVHPLNFDVVFGFGTKIDACYTDANSGCGWAFYLDGTVGRNASLTFTVKVGDVIPIFSGIDISGDAYVDAAHSATSNPQDWSSAAAVNMSHTAGMWFSDIPTGVQLASVSGFDYTVKPSTTGVVTPNAPVVSARWLPGSSQVELCWSSQTNINYQAQFQPLFGLNQWVDFGAPIIGNGSTNCLDDVVAAAQPQRMYRVVAFP